MTNVSEMVCALCMFVAEDKPMKPAVTVMNGNATCEDHNGYFQGGAISQAIVAYRAEQREEQHP